MWGGLLHGRGWLTRVIAITTLLEPEEDLPHRVSSVTREIWEHSYGLE